MNFSKSATSLMICGSADGVLLHPISYTKVYTFMIPGKKELHVVHHVAISLVALQDHDLTVQSISGWIDAPTCGTKGRT